MTAALLLSQMKRSYKQLFKPSALQRVVQGIRDIAIKAEERKRKRVTTDNGGEYLEREFQESAKTSVS